MNLTETAQIVAVLAIAHTGWELGELEIQVWHTMLEDLDAERTAAVAADMVKTDPKWPTIATIRRKYAEHAGLTAPSPADAWTEAMANTSGLRNEYDPYPSTFEPWSHAAIGQAVAVVGGLWAIAKDPESTTLHAQFRRAYEDYAARADEAAVLDLTPPQRELMPASPEIGASEYYL